MRTCVCVCACIYICDTHTSIHTLCMYICLRTLFFLLFVIRSSLPIPVCPPTGFFLAFLSSISVCSFLVNPGTQEYQPILLLAQSYNPSSIVSKLLFPFTTAKHTNEASPHPKKTTRKSSGFICSFSPTIQSILSNVVFINLLNSFFLPLCLSVVMVFLGNT